jgi:hypothetical protein
VRTAILLDEDHGRSERSDGSEECGIPESGSGHLRQAAMTDLN